MSKNLNTNFVKVSIASAIVFMLVSCSSESADDKTEVSVAIENSYIDILGRTPECISKIIEGYEFVQCDNDLWLNGNNGEYYAINGKAMTSLENLKTDTHFLQLPPRVNVDVGGVKSIFDGDVNANSEKLIKVVSEKDISELELNAYCSYQQEKEALSIEANHKFGDQGDALLSEKRENWITPKIKKLQKHYFEDQGKKYEEEFIRIADSGMQCSR